MVRGARHFTAKHRKARAKIPSLTSEEKHMLKEKFSALAEQGEPLELGSYGVQGNKRDRYDVVSIHKALPYLKEMGNVRIMVPFCAIARFLSSSIEHKTQSLEYCCFATIMCVLATVICAIVSADIDFAF